MAVFGHPLDEEDDDDDDEFNEDFILFTKDVKSVFDSSTRVLKANNYCH